MNPGQPAISVLVVTHNGARHVAETIESVLAQTFDDWEMIVVDDGSTDLTLDIVRSFDDPRISVLPQAHLGDWSHWRNVAARDHARGEYLAVLDHDDLWLPEKLARQHAALETTDAVLSYTGWAAMFEDGRTVTVLRPPLDGSERDDRLAMLIHPERILHSSIVVRRSAFLDVDGYHGDPRVNDIKLGHDLRRVGAFACIDAPLSIWRRHGAQTTRDEESMAALAVDLLRDIARDPGEHPEIRAQAARAADITLARSITGDRGRAGFRMRVRSSPRDARAWLWLIASYVPRPVLLRVRTLYQHRPRGARVRKVGGQWRRG